MLLGAGNFFANLLLQSSAKLPKMKKVKLTKIVRCRFDGIYKQRLRDRR